MSNMEICRVLLDNGVEIVKEKPSSAVNFALSRRAKRKEDVVRVQRGKWAIRSWYTAEQLAEILSSLTKTPSRDADLHSSSTKEGMASAKARGVRIGRENFDDIYVKTGRLLEFQQELQRSGVTQFKGAQLKDVLNRFKIPMPTYRKYQHVFNTVPNSDVPQEHVDSQMVITTSPEEKGGRLRLVK